MKALTYAETFPCARSVVGQSHTEALGWQWGVKRQADRESKEVQENVGTQCKRLCEGLLNS